MNGNVQSHDPAALHPFRVLDIPAILTCSLLGRERDFVSNLVRKVADVVVYFAR